MGWKSYYVDYFGRQAITSQSAFAGYGLEEFNMKNKMFTLLTSQSAFAGYGLEEFLAGVFLWFGYRVAIRFRWIWVGRDFRKYGTAWQMVSQSAFAGYGLEEKLNF